MSRNSVKKQGGKQAMREICWTAADLKELSEKVPDGESVAILHLLRYRDSVGTGRNDMTGRQSFERYFQGSLPILMKVGARPLWRGQVRFVLFGGEVERWEEAVLVTFPTLGAFQRMLAVDQDLHQTSRHKIGCQRNTRMVRMNDFELGSYLRRKV